MEFYTRLRALRIQKELTQKDLGKMIGVSLTTIGNWESGIKSPSMGAIIALSGALQVSADELLGISRNTRLDSLPLNRSERDLISKYRVLDSHGKLMVDSVCRLELRRIESSARRDITLIDCETTMERPNRMIRKYLTPSAAGFSAPIDGVDYEMIQADCDVPDRADFAVKIQGHSMEPYISDGDTVFVERTEELSIGEIGIFSVDGAMYCKQYFVDGAGNMTLVSANEAEARSNVFVSAECSGSTEVHCYGRVLLSAHTVLPDYFLRSQRTQQH